MSGIFLSYRREDSAGWTGRLAEDLKERFGHDSIFMDIDTIEPGADFTEALQKAVSACDVLLAIIGPEWGTVADKTGKPRLDDPTDWVRVEIATALKRKILVIPVLVGGASVPTQDLLPDELDPLAHRQALELTDKRWDYDVEQLVQVLPGTRQIPPASPKAALVASSTWQLNPFLISGILFVLGIVVWSNLPSSKNDIPSENRDSPQPASPLSSTRTSPIPASPSQDMQSVQPQARQLKVREKPPASKPSPAPSVSITTPPPPGSRGSKAINLLAAEQGGHLLVASGDEWARTIDGKEERNHINSKPAEAVYAFKDERSATIDLFTMLIPETNPYNVKEFELLMGHDSPTGSFESLGRFQTQNVKLMKTPYQEFSFPPVKGKYLKLKVHSTYGSTSPGGTSPTVAEVQLFGRLDAGPPAPSPSTTASPPGSRGSKASNLLAAEQGGHVLVASGDEWTRTIDGKEEPNHINHQPAEAVYAFKDERSATIDLFTMLIPETNPYNVKEFELLMGHDSPTGSFESLGRFQTQNVKLMKTPYQEFSFPPVKGKYLKLKVHSTYGSTSPGGTSPTVAEVQLFGRLDAE